MVRAARHAGDGLFAARRRRHQLLRDPTLARIGAAHGCSAAAVALAWAIRSGNVIAIPESGSRGACKGERRRALTDADAAGASDAGCSVSTAQPLRRRVLFK